MSPVPGNRYAGFLGDLGLATAPGYPTAGVRMRRKDTMPAYDLQSIGDLAEATQYESWLLEAAYSIVEDELFPEWPDQMIYPASGGTPRLAIFGRANGVIGDWRPEFLRVGAPLIFITTFKLLDMLVEWVLAQNGHTSTYRFSQKIATLKTNLTFPPFLASRSWLKERLIALYERLDPLRGTIIHARYFKTTDGALDVASSRRNNVGPTISLAPKEIRSLTVFILSVLRYVDGSWQPDIYREKLLRRTLDELAHLHGLSSMNQLSPHSLTVRVYFVHKESVTINIARIRREVSAQLPDHDVVFDLRLVAIQPDGSSAAAYLLPWAMLRHETGSILLQLAKIADYRTELPPDFDARAVMRELVKVQDAQSVAS